MLIWEIVACLSNGFEEKKSNSLRCGRWRVLGNPTHMCPGRNTGISFDLQWKITLPIFPLNLFRSAGRNAPAERATDKYPPTTTSIFLPANRILQTSPLTSQKQSSPPTPKHQNTTRQQVERSSILATLSPSRQHNYPQPRHRTP